MKKSGWLLLPTAFFLLFNFSISNVEVLFIHRLLYFLFLIFLFLILRRFSLDRILPPIVGGVSFILFTYGILQKFMLFPFYLRNIIPEDNFYSQALITRIKGGRVFSLLSLPTLYAIICTILIIFILHYLWVNRQKKIIILWGFLLTAGLFNLILTQSFGGIIYLSAGVLFYFFASGVIKFKYLAPVIMVLSLFFFVTIALRFSEAKEFEPVKLRLSNWQQALRMIESSPIWGVGLGNYEANISYYTKASEAKSLYAHNFFLQFFAETGFILPIFLTLLLFISRKKIFQIDIKKNTLYLSILLVVFIYNLIDIGFYFFSAGITTVVALSQIFPIKNFSFNFKPKENIRFFSFLFIGVLLSTLLVFKGISDYHRKSADFSFAQQDYSEAEKYYKSSIHIYPYNYNSLLNLAQISFHLNNPGKTQNFLNRVFEFDPYSSIANYLQSKIEFGKGRFLGSYCYAFTAHQKNPIKPLYKRWYKYLKKSVENLIMTVINPEGAKNARVDQLDKDK